MKKQITLAVVSLISIFGILSLVYIMINKPEVYPQINKIKSSDHIKWANDKKNILVEYSDFFCPACKTTNEFLNQFESTQSSEFKTAQKITFVYRHFPIHEQSYGTAYAAEAAAKQGKYYQMIDLIFKNQENLLKSKDLKGDLVKLAADLKLNLDQFKKDVDSSEVREKVREDQVSGNGAGISATPSFFLNGKKLDFKTLDEFKQTLSSSLN